MNCDGAGAALAAHLAVGAAGRTAKWRFRLYDLIETTRWCERDPRISIGADGFPYYALDLPADGGSAGTIALSALIPIATSSGFGIVIASGRCEPWRFTCGDLVTRRAFGSYEFPRIGTPPAAGPVLRGVRREAADMSIGAPPATLLPGFVRPLLQRYFTQRLGIADPGVLATLSADQDPPEQLVFRLSRADFTSDGDLAAALSGLGWFLPRHVVVAVLPPDVVAGLEPAFVPLSG